MTPRRAIREDQKQERRQALLDTAWELFQATSYQEVTMAGVAEQLGLAKGTVYLYFKTKEELFLAIQEAQLQAWFDEVNDRLTAAAQSPGNTHRVATILCETLEARPHLTRLLAILHSILEQNIDFDTAVAFKQMLLHNLTHTGALLEACLPFLAPSQGIELLLRTQAMVIGFQHLASPGPVVQQVLQQPDMDIFVIDFAHNFSTTLRALLHGLEAEARATPATHLNT